MNRSWRTNVHIKYKSYSSPTAFREDITFQRIENILKCLKTTNLRTTCLYINPFLIRVTSIIHEPTGTQECIMNYNRRSQCQQFCDKSMLRLQYTVLTCCDVKTWSKHSQASFRGDQRSQLHRKFNDCIESLMIA